MHQNKKIDILGQMTEKTKTNTTLKIEKLQPFIIEQNYEHNKDCIQCTLWQLN